MECYLFIQHLRSLLSLWRRWRWTLILAGMPLMVPWLNQELIRLATTSRSTHHNPIHMFFRFLLGASQIQTYWSVHERLIVARDFEDFLDEDECCLECGEIDYTPSKTIGICLDCWAELTHQESKIENLKVWSNEKTPACAGVFSMYLYVSFKTSMVRLCCDPFHYLSPICKMV